LAHRTRRVTTALIGALALAGGLLLAAPVAAIAPPGGIEEFPFPSIGTEDSPGSGFVAGPDGNIWFTGNTSSGGTSVGKVGLITLEGLIHEYAVAQTYPGSATPEEPEHSDPYQIAQGPNDTLWFTDLGINNNDEQLIGQVTLGKGEPQIKEFQDTAKEDQLGSIAAGPEGNMWYSTARFGGEDQIWWITPKGEPHLVVGLGSHRFYPNVGGIAQGPGGLMWFTERDENERGEDEGYIGRYDTSTKVYEHFPILLKNSYPSAIAPGPNGNMWFVESGANQIGEITPTGAIKEFPAVSTNYSSDGIVEGPDGNMWFTQSGIDSIGRLTPSGEVKSFLLPTPESEPTGIARGSDGNMWFMDDRSTEVIPGQGAFYHVGRLTTPFLPVSASPPAISGTPTQGQALSATQGSWTNNPGVFTYQWEDCDSAGNNCAALSGETGVTHFLTPGDVGHTLRVVVTATNVAGSASAVSGPSAVIAPAPPPPPPRVEASMTWTFGWTRKYSVVESLIVHGVPKGGHVEVVCHGHGCPFSHHHSATVASHHHQACHGSKCKKAKPKPKPQGPEVILTDLFKGRHLRVGTSISISVVKAGWVGKSFVFTTRSNRTPLEQTACLAPGSSKPGKDC
jgi:virginiamycin B lyase